MKSMIRCIQQSLHKMSKCKGIAKSSGRPCTNKASNMWGFCGKHYRQSQEYAKTAPEVAMMIGLCDEIGTEMFLTVRRNTEMNKIFSAYARTYLIASRLLQVKRNGQVIGLVSPEDAELAGDVLESNDRLYAY